MLANNHRILFVRSNVAMFDLGQNTLFGKKTIKTISYNEQEIIRQVARVIFEAIKEIERK